MNIPSPVQAGPVTPPDTKGWRVGCLLFFLILIVILVPVGLAMVNVSQVGHLMKAVLSGDMAGARTILPTLNKRIRVAESGVLVPSPADALPDIVVLTTQYPLGSGQLEHRLVALSGVEPRMLWQSPPLGQDTYRLPILAGNDLVYILQEDRLMAMHRAGGSVAWEIGLSDVISPYLCQDCVRLLGDRLFTLTDDGVLRATDAHSGALVWDATALQDSPRGLYVLGDRLAFMDRDENNKGLLRVFDPASGEIQTAQPTCPTLSSHLEYADWTTPLYPSSDGNSFTVLFGSSQLCIQRWDARRLEQLWSTEMPDDVDDEGQPIASKETIYVGGDGQLFAVSAATGELRTLLQDSGYKNDYDFVPLAVVGNDLLVRAVRQRGSQRFEIWLVDRTGRDGVRWRFDLGRKLTVHTPGQR